MHVLKGVFAAVVLSVMPAFAFAAEPGTGAPPCGWKGGAMADPATTRQCLAERFKAAKPKAPPARKAPPAALKDGTAKADPAGAGVRTDSSS
jgi:hypothetical protein